MLWSLLVISRMKTWHWYGQAKTTWKACFPRERDHQRSNSLWASACSSFRNPIVWRIDSLVQVVLQMGNFLLDKWGCPRDSLWFTYLHIEEMIRVQDGLITIPTTHVIPLTIWIGKSEWHTYKRDDVDKPEPTEYYNPRWGICCRKRKLYGEVKPHLSWRRRDPAMKVLTYHESFDRIDAVLHWTMSN